MEEPVEIVSGDFLNFSKNHLITGINVIEDLLFWTDNYNQPRKININKAINDPTYYDSEDKISVAKIAPYAAPLIHEHQNLHTVTTENTLKTDANVNSDYLKENFVRFSYRYKYEDNEYSLIAPFTQVVFEPLNNGCIIDDATQSDLTSADTTPAGIAARANYEFGTKKAIDTGRIATMQNAINRVKLRIPLPYNNDALTATTRTLTSAIGSPTSTSIALTGSSLPDNHYIVKGTFTSATEAGNAKTHDLTQFIASGVGANPTINLDSGQVSGPISSKLAFVPMWENYVGLKSIEILIKESDDAAVRVVGEIDVRDIRDFKDNVDVYPIRAWSTMPTYYRYCYVFDYKSEKPYKVIPEDQVNRVSDDVPIRAQAQEVVSNRVVYGNYLKNYQYPTDAAGNKGINYIVTSLAKGENEYDSTASEPKYWLNLQHNEYAYKYGSLKQRRTYQVGIVLSDRYGRQSPVILSSAKKGNNVTTQNDSPDTITTVNQTGSAAIGYSLGPNGTSANFTWSRYELDVIGRTLGIEFQDSFLVPADQSYSNNNNLGWYSYRVVVKQTQQDYYNVYTPHPVALADSTNTASYMTLFSDNINKVPRSILDQDINRNNISGSDVFLFPKVQALSSGSFDSKLQTSYSSKLIDVISLGTIQEQDSEYDLTNSTASLLSTSGNASLVYKSERGPLVAEIENLATFYGGLTSPTHLRGLSVFETEPFDSKLDIYYETSTTGLVTDLNWGLQLAPPASAPEEESIEFQGTPNVLTKSFIESKTTGSLGTVVATAGTGGNTLVYELLNLWSYNGVGRDDFKNRVSLNSSTGVLSLSGVVASGTGFAHRNSDYDKYDVVLKVSEYAGKDYAGSSIRTLQLQVTNDNPSIQLYNSSGTLASSSRSAEVNFYERFNVKLDNGYTHSGAAENGGTDSVEKYRGLTYAITFPNITNTQLRTWAERSFKVEQKANGKIDIKTTYVWEINENWSQEPLNIETPQGQTKQDFFDLLPAERTMTITVSDNASTPLTNTATLQIDEAIPLLKMNSIYIANSGELNPDTKPVSGRKSIEFNRSAFIGRGKNLQQVNILKPRKGNAIYFGRDEKKASEISYAFTGRDIFIIYNYTKLGYDGKQAYYDIAVVSNGVNSVDSSFLDSYVLYTDTILVADGETAAEKIVQFGDEQWPTKALSGSNKLFNFPT